MVRTVSPIAVIVAAARARSPGSTSTVKRSWRSPGMPRSRKFAASPADGTSATPWPRWVRLHLLPPGRNRAVNAAVAGGDVEQHAAERSRQLLHALDGLAHLAD